MEIKALKPYPFHDAAQVRTGDKALLHCFMGTVGNSLPKCKSKPTS